MSKAPLDSPVTPRIWASSTGATKKQSESSRGQNSIIQSYRRADRACPVPWCSTKQSHALSSNAHVRKHHFLLPFHCMSRRGSPYTRLCTEKDQSFRYHYHQSRQQHMAQRRSLRWQTCMSRQSRGPIGLASGSAQYRMLRSMTVNKTVMSELLCNGFVTGELSIPNARRAQLMKPWNSSLLIAWPRDTTALEACSQN